MRGRPRTAAGSWLRRIQATPHRRRSSLDNRKNCKHIRKDCDQNFDPMKTQRRAKERGWRYAGEGSKCCPGLQPQELCLLLPWEHSYLHHWSCQSERRFLRRCRRRKRRKRRRRMRTQGGKSKIQMEKGRKRMRGGSGQGGGKRGGGCWRWRSGRSWFLPSD